MNSVHQISAPSTPNVSPVRPKYERGVCRFCGCHGGRCPVPEGQFGYRTCFWLDKEKTVCAAPVCTFRWEQEKKGIAVDTVEMGQAPDPFHALLVIRHYRGIQARIAKRLGISRQAVSQVVSGERKSARISAALAEESALTDLKVRRTVLSGNGARAQETRSRQAFCGSNGQASQPGPERRAVSPSSSAPRIALRYEREEGGVLFAVHPSLTRPVAIARRQAPDPIGEIAQRLGVARQTINNNLSGKWCSKRVRSALLAAGLAPAEPKKFGNPEWTSLSDSYGSIAKRLGVRNSAVWSVANGRAYSRRISEALDLELAARRKTS
jgi:transcriptional regulator with XRE-family HTH domain